MKVLHVVSGLSPHFGGPTAALVGLAKAQSKVGLEVSVLTHHSPESQSILNQLETSAVRVIALKSRLGHLSPPRPVVHQIEQAVSEADIVHSHGLWDALPHQVACTARRLKTPYLIRPCGMLDPWSLAQNGAKKRMYMLWRQRKDLDGAVALHFSSQGERESASHVGLKVRSLIEPNGIDLEEFENLPSPGGFRRQHPEIGDKFLIVFLARIHPGKGLDLLVPALAHLSEREVIAVVGGPDSQGYRATIERMIEQNRVRDKILFAGMLDRHRCIAALSDADLFVLPSYHENFGNAVVEALAAGTPVIISDQVKIHDQITAAGVGATVPIEVGALASAIEQWMGDDELRLSAAQKCRPFVWKQFNWEQIAQRWKEHYPTMIR